MQHHEQPVVTLRLLVRAGAAQDPAGKQGVAVLVGGAARPGRRHARRPPQIADAIDTIGGALGDRRRQRPSVADVLVMKDSLDLRLRSAVRRRAASRVRSGGARSPAPAGALGLKVNYEDPDYVAEPRVRSARLRLPSVRAAQHRHAGVAGEAHASTTCARSTRPGSCPTTRILGIVGDVSSAEALAAAEKAFGDWQPADLPKSDHAAPPPPTRRVVVIDKPGRRADGDARRAHRPAAHAPGLPGVRPGLRRFSAARAPTACIRCCGPIAA